MSGKIFRRLGCLLSLSAVCVLLGFGVWKVWPLGKEIYGIFAESARYKSLPNPVVVKDGVYWFPLGERVYAVPENYVESYGRNSTDGNLYSFSLHALLPDFVGRSPETIEKFKASRRDDRINIMVSRSRSSTREEEEKFYYGYYLLEKDSFKKWYGQDPVVLSENPHVERLTPIKGTDKFFLLEDQRVKKKLTCMIKEESYQCPSCKDISMYYRDNIRLWITYSRSYEKDWIAIEDRLVSWLDSFERPVEDL
jgi:hypothetical protein